MSFRCFQLFEASLIAALFLFNNFHWVEILAEKMCLLWEMKDYDKESLAEARGHKCCSAVCFIYTRNQVLPHQEGDSDPR